MADFAFYKALFAQYSIELTPEQYEKLDIYANLLISEQAVQNVTAIRDYKDIWVRHFLDAAYMEKYFSPGQKVLDLGTGGGIPALPLAVLLPDTRFTLLDSELKKIEFCRKAAEKMGIRAEYLAGRAEELARQPEYRGMFDCVISRAMARGTMLMELGIPFLRTGGTLYAMKGRGFDEDFERFAQSAAILGCAYRLEAYEIEQEPKTLVIAAKKQDTPEKFPRRFAKIKREPL